MKSPLIPFLLLISTLCSAEDPQLRQQAIALLEHATKVSSVANLPNLERVDTFQVFEDDGSIQPGTFSRVVIQGTGRRDETTFGSYHVIDIWTNHRLATVRTNEIAPPEVENLHELTPINLVQFDHEDVIEEITTRESGAQPLRCIEFETIAGTKNKANEICIDAKNGTVVSERLFDNSVENSEFFPFAGALLPGKIRYSERGVLKMEIAQTMTQLTETDANVLTAPPVAQIRVLCKTFRRPFGQSMPQPKPGNGGTDTDILVRGLISADGRVHDAVIQSSTRPDLNPEALQLIQQWTFSPEMCNGKPNQTEGDFTLHFQGR